MAKGKENKPCSEDLDKSVSDALDAVFDREEETYDHFLQSFIFLKKGLFKQSSSTTCTSSSMENADTHKRRSVDRCAGDGTVNLPTEELGLGEKSGTMAGPLSGRIVKLDNFIAQDQEDSDSESENEDMECCYVPSAVQQPHSQVQVLSHTTDMQTNCPISMENSQNEPSSMEEQKRTHGYGVVSTFPGEVDASEIETSVTGKRQPNIRCLEISARSRLTHDREEDTKDPEDRLCKVEPFELDKDFDYENVPHTPKFDFLQRKPS